METINGLPAHVLLVHLVVVMLPLASALAVIGSLWPAAQRKFTFLTPLAALAGLVAVPLTINAGAALADHLQLGEAINQHATLGRRVLPMAIALFVTTAGQWAYLAYARPKTWVTILIAALVIISAVATTVQVTLTGDAGARMVWGSTFE